MASAGSRSDAASCCSTLCGEPLASAILALPALLTGGALPAPAAARACLTACCRAPSNAKACCRVCCCASMTG